MSARRGPYRKPRRLHLDEKPTWRVGDTVTTGTRRWVINHITGTMVVLTSSNTNHGIRWTTTPTHLPEKTTP